jgi:hypothetical protein
MSEGVVHPVTVNPAIAIFLRCLVEPALDNKSSAASYPVPYMYRLIKGVNRARCDRLVDPAQQASENTCADRETDPFVGEGRIESEKRNCNASVGPLQVLNLHCAGVWLEFRGMKRRRKAGLTPQARVLRLGERNSWRISIFGPHYRIFS